MEKKEYLSPQKTKTIRGLLCILILVHHIYQYRLNSIVPTFVGGILQNLGFWCVALFFFQSGYQLSYSVTFKNNYIDSFVKKKIFPLFISYSFFIFIYLLFYLISGVNQLSSLWFFQTLLFLYFLFYFSYKRENGIRLIFPLGILIYFSICILMKLQLNYYATVLCFPLGILWNNHYPKIEKVLKKRGILLLMVNVLMLFFFFLLSKGIDINALKNLFFIISNVLFVTLFLQINRYIFFDNKYLITLGNYSLELYSIQFIFIRLLEYSNIYIYIFIVFFLTIIFAVVINKLIGFIMRSIKWKET